MDAAARATVTAVPVVVTALVACDFEAETIVSMYWSGESISTTAGEISAKSAPRIGVDLARLAWATVPAMAPATSIMMRRVHPTGFVIAKWSEGCV